MLAAPAKALRAGVKREACPYRLGRPREEWLHGWDSAMQWKARSFEKYIQAREPQYVDRAHAAGPAIASPRLDAAAVQQVQSADTFFIATAHPDAGRPQGQSHGVDVSHRGGKPGFVRVSEDAAGQQWLTAPDFLGNFFFNTLGNIALSPRAGLLFVDFDRGDLLYVAVHASVVWDGPELASFAGAQRLLQMRVLQTLLAPAALPLRWGPAQLSPVLAPTGAWH